MVARLEIKRTKNHTPCQLLCERARPNLSFKSKTRVGVMDGAIGSDGVEGCWVAAARLSLSHSLASRATESLRKERDSFLYVGSVRSVRCLGSHEVFYQARASLFLGLSENPPLTSAAGNMKARTDYTALMFSYAFWPACGASDCALKGVCAPLAAE